MDARDDRLVQDERASAREMTMIRTHLRPWTRPGGRWLAVLWLVATAGCSEQQAAQTPPKPPPVPVRVATVERQDVRRSVTLVGTVEPWKRSIVASELAGRVVNFPVKAGRQVRRGELLARLDTDTLMIQLESATASRAEGVVRHDQAKLDLERIKALFEKEAVTRKERDDAISEELALRRRLTQLDAEIRRVRDRIKKSRIVAPFDGWIIEEHTEIGQWVEEGGPVVEMVDLSRLQLEVPVPERFVPFLRRGDPITAVFDGLPGFKATGEVFSIVAQADRAARTFPVKMEIPNPEFIIKSGMVARVTITVGETYQALVVPKDALVLKGGNQFVFLIENGVAVQQQVKPGIHTDGLVEVSGDLQAGMDVVVQGNERLLPGQSVRVLNNP